MYDPCGSKKLDGHDLLVLIAEDLGITVEKLRMRLLGIV